MPRVVPMRPFFRLELEEQLPKSAGSAVDLSLIVVHHELLHGIDGAIGEPLAEEGGERAEAPAGQPPQWQKP